MMKEITQDQKNVSSINRGVSHDMTSGLIFFKLCIIVNVQISYMTMALRMSLLILPFF